MKSIRWMPHRGSVSVPARCKDMIRVAGQIESYDFGMDTGASYSSGPNVILTLLPTHLFQFTILKHPRWFYQYNLASSWTSAFETGEVKHERFIAMSQS